MSAQRAALDAQKTNAQQPTLFSIGIVIVNAAHQARTARFDKEPIYCPMRTAMTTQFNHQHQGIRNRTLASVVHGSIRSLRSHFFISVYRGTWETKKLSEMTVLR